MEFTTSPICFSKKASTFRSKCFCLSRRYFTRWYFGFQWSSQEKKVGFTFCTERSRSLSSNLNMTTDRQSRHVKDSSEWKSPQGIYISQVGEFRISIWLHQGFLIGSQLIWHANQTRKHSNRYHATIMTQLLPLCIPSVQFSTTGDKNQLLLSNVNLTRK